MAFFHYDLETMVPDDHVLRTFKERLLVNGIGRDRGTHQPREGIEQPAHHRTHPADRQGRSEVCLRLAEGVAGHQRLGTLTVTANLRSVLQVRLSTLCWKLTAQSNGRVTHKTAAQMSLALLYLTSKETVTPSRLSCSHVQLGRPRSVASPPADGGKL